MQLLKHIRVERTEELYIHVIKPGLTQRYCNKFEETMLWKNPRVSLETLFDAILQQHPRSEEKSFRKFSTLTELQEFVKTITEFDMCI